MKKEEMIAAMNDCFNNMNDAGVEALFNIIMPISEKERWQATTSPERIAELDALNLQKEIQEKQEKEEARQQKELQRNQTYLDHARMFDAINSVSIPARYDISTDEIKAIDLVCGEISRCFPQYAFDVANYYFCYGFVKGSRYARALAKKKSKKESH